MGVIVVFGKPPVPGVSKTRLGATIGPERAALVARAMLKDSVERYRGRGAEVVVATTDVNADHGINAPMWDQGPGDLGARIERMLVRGGRFGWALAVGADAPHVPEEALGAALVALDSGRNVFGPSEDGGFWALGLQACPTGLLADLPWSAPTTGSATLLRLTQRALAPVVLPEAWDVDTFEDLARISAYAHVAPHTALLAC